jgi:hypothetical protein
VALSLVDVLVQLHSPQVVVVAAHISNSAHPIGAVIVVEENSRGKCSLGEKNVHKLAGY